MAAALKVEALKRELQKETLSLMEEEAASSAPHLSAQKEIEEILTLQAEAKVLLEEGGGKEDVSSSLVNSLGKTCPVPSSSSFLRSEELMEGTSSMTPLASSSSSSLSEDEKQKAQQTRLYKGLLLLEKASYLCEQFAHQHPKLMKVASSMMEGVLKTSEYAVTLQMGLTGAAAGMAFCGPPCAVVGGISGLMVSKGVGNVMAAGVSSTLEGASTLAASYATSASEAKRFKDLTLKTGVSLFTLMALRGAHKQIKGSTAYQQRTVEGLDLAGHQTLKEKEFLSQLVTSRVASPGLLPGQPSKNRACDFHRTRLKH